jgi:hypothetical protein
MNEGMFSVYFILTSSYPNKFEWRIATIVQTVSVAARFLIVFWMF